MQIIDYRMNDWALLVNRLIYWPCLLIACWCTWGIPGLKWAAWLGVVGTLGAGIVAEFRKR